ncbi:Cna protein B-type domain-containing protein [Lentzea albidocapillata subsp. violacea]|uniref:Cna protein B-type domain-containing protein n=1 Tax=Lentzea albidocapillata subsp. violacea TaxID=128104 RepID=A0A1G9DQW8_9PSEU|nr:SdrD B-like domain-containing protein [Lentzea albidocapillata]SDK66224.1 Cna protein B-type domain-containing protein [Lentzea albidocapillata subsp. violacea]
MIGVLGTVAALTFSTASVGAFAQDDPSSTSPAPTTTTTAPPVSARPPSSEPPPPPVVAPVAATGHIAGVVYVDRNGNRQQDRDEAASGIDLMISGNGAEHRTTTDADGKFGFRDLAPGAYKATYFLDDEWTVHVVNVAGDPIKVESNKTAQVVARGERPYDEQFSVSGTLDQDSYRMPATATVTLVFTNNTTNRISNIRARCDHESSPKALGRGKAWNALTANGVSLAPGERRAITVDEEVPEGAGRAGVVTLDCKFAPNPDLNLGPWARTTAKVTSSTNYAMVVGEDKDADDLISRDEVVSGVTVVLLNEQTGFQASEGTSGEDGRIEFFNVVPGVYRAVVLGPWGFRDSGRERVVVTDQGGFGQGFLKQASPADVRASIKLDKSRYQAHETVGVELTITNVGGRAAEQVGLTTMLTELDVPDEQWGDLGRSNGAGIRLAAGESRTVNVSGRIQALLDGRLVIVGGVSYLGQPDNEDGEFRAEAEVVETRGDIVGVVYTDKNGNGRQDEGEAAPGVLVEASGGTTHDYYSATTDANGGFTFEGVSSGGYWITYLLADDWIVHDEVNPAQVWVEPTVPTRLTVRADRPYRELIEATMAFGKDTYMVGETAEVVITLKNVSGRPLSGVQASCNPLGHQDQLGGGYRRSTPEGWGELRQEAAGVTLGPGESRTVTVTEAVPAYARFKQQVAVGCSFAPNAKYNTDGPWALDIASVLVGVGAVQGKVAHDRNKNGVVDSGEAVTGVRVLLLTEREYGLQVADSVSGTDGTVRFDRMPTGQFWTGIDGAWKFEGESGRVEVKLDEVAQRDFFVVPDPSAQPPGTGSTGGALAKTGASVLGLGVIAVLLVAFGFGARVAGHRKKP